jgi:hypothetical protein
MKKVVIGFSKSTKKYAIGSLLIRSYMGTPYSHVYIKFYSSTFDRELIYEAVGSGVRFIGIDRWKQHAVEVDSFEIELCDESYKRLMQYCIDNSGVEYGFFQNLGIIWANICKLAKNPVDDGENCSEIIGEILALQGYTINKDFNLLTPKDIWLILNNKTI